MGGCKRVFKGIWGTTVVRGGGYIQVSCCNSLDELLGGYDWGMGNRGEVFMTWEGFEPGTWSLELWDLKRFELRTL